MVSTGRHLSMLRSYTAADLLTIGNAGCGTIAIFLCLDYLATDSRRFLWTAFLLLPLALYRLLSPHGRTAATLMVALAVASVPLSFVNLQHKLDVLTLLGDDPYRHAFAPDALNAQVMLALQAYGNGILVAKLFWGLWLLPLGWLVFSSRQLPRVLGILLMLGCAGYVIDVFARLLAPGFAASPMAGYITLPATLGEIGTCLWLLVFGVRGASRLE